MVSGFLISPNDHERIFSGLASEIRIWSKVWGGADRVEDIQDFLVHGRLLVRGSPPSRSVRRKIISGRRAISRAVERSGAPRRQPRTAYSAASAGGSSPIGFFVVVSSTLRPSERISLTSTLKLSGMPASKVSSPRTIAS